MKASAMRVILILWWLATTSSAVAAGFDRTHQNWTTLLARHVHWNAAGTATSVDYAGFQRDHAALERYLDTLSAVDAATFAQWTQAERHAFLINTYNAYTIELVLTRYPGLTSIKDIGGVFSSPWKQRFFKLLGETHSLDEVEHDLLRGAPGFDEPRIHFAVNCASIGCPALRPEAYTGAHLDAQLADQTARFLRDRTRNRITPSHVEVSMIFRWYGDDFMRAGGVPGFLAGHGAALGADAAQRQALRSGRLTIQYLPYDWRLNSIDTKDKRWP